MIEIVPVEGTVSEAAAGLAHYMGLLLERGPLARTMSVQASDGSKIVFQRVGNGPVVRALVTSGSAWIKLASAPVPVGYPLTKLQEFPKRLNVLVQQNPPDVSGTSVFVPSTDAVPEQPQGPWTYYWPHDSTISPLVSCYVGKWNGTQFLPQSGGANDIYDNTFGYGSGSPRTPYCRAITEVRRYNSRIVSFRSGNTTQYRAEFTWDAKGYEFDGNSLVFKTLFEGAGGGAFGWSGWPSITDPEDARLDWDTDGWDDVVSNISWTQTTDATGGPHYVSNTFNIQYGTSGVQYVMGRVKGSMYYPPYRAAQPAYPGGYAVKRYWQYYGNGYFGITYYDANGAIIGKPTTTTMSPAWGNKSGWEVFAYPADQVYTLLKYSFSLDKKIPGTWSTSSTTWYDWQSMSGVTDGVTVPNYVAPKPSEVNLRAKGAKGSAPFAVEVNGENTSYNQSSFNNCAFVFGGKVNGVPCDDLWGVFIVGGLASSTPP